MPIETDVETMRDSLAEIVQSVFTTMMGLEVARGGLPWHSSSERLTAAVHLAGAWDGAVLFECNRGQACRFAGRFLSADPSDDVDDVVRDVLGEIANMMGGNLKCLLPHGVSLSTPYVVDGGDYNLRFCGSDLCDRLAFDTIEGPVWITLLSTQPLTHNGRVSSGEGIVTQ